MSEPNNPVSIEPHMRQVKGSDQILWLGAIALSFALSSGLFYLLVELLNPPSVGDFLMPYFFSAVDYFPAKQAPANSWDLTLMAPFVLSWILNKIAIVVVAVAMLVIVAALYLIPLFGITAIFAKLFWVFHFKARLTAGAIPQRHHE